MFNGQFTSALLWLITGLATIISALIGFIVHLHIKADDDDKRLAARELEILRDHLNAEINRLRDRMHDAEGSLRDQEHRKETK